MPASAGIVDNCSFEEPLLERRCRWCSKLFHVCRRCNRGHAYCSAACRVSGYRERRRAANRRHRHSPEGREDHAARQRGYRADMKRRARSVLDNTLARTAQMTGFVVAALCGLSPTPTENVDEEPSVLRCAVCDRASSLVVPSRWVDDRSYRRTSFVGDTPGGAR